MKNGESFRTEIHDYEVEFDGAEPMDANGVQAAMLIRDILVTLDVPFKEIKVKKIIKYVFEATKGDIAVEFVGEEPEYWYAEADIREKVVEVGINDHRMRIPLMTILYWFSKEETEDMR